MAKLPHGYLKSMSSDQAIWSFPRRIAFRFLFSYLVLFNIPQAGSASIFDLLPWGSAPISAYLAKPMQPVALWLGQHVFHLQGIAATFHPTGSGDTSLNYVLVFLCLCLALVATAIWSVLDRRRTQYRTLDAWLRLFISFVLAVALEEYGFAKIFPGQFGPVSMSRLNETYGESSPMALLWTFMSGSRWYTMFGGFAEVVPGLLLFFRRTRTLGALLASGVLLNIVLLNFCYDIPVKLYSSHLLFMGLFLAAPDLAALLRLFVFRKQVQLRTDHVPAVERRWLRRTSYALLGLVILCTLVSTGLGAYSPYPSADDTTVPLYGQWHVTSAASTVPGVPWLEISRDSAQSMRVRRVDGTSIQLDTKFDTAKQNIALTGKTSGPGDLHYTIDPANSRHVTLTGTFNKGQVRFDLLRRNPDQYLLLTRGFHWINEVTPNW